MSLLSSSVVLLSSLLGVVTSWAQTSSVPVAGQVYYADEATPAVGFRVIFFNLADLRRAGSALTDSDGNFMARSH
jgi:hypothetical protein